MVRSILIILTMATLLSGCVTTVNIHSDIDGASVATTEGKALGQTPVSVQIPNKVFDAHKDPYGCAEFPGIILTWPSGAITKSDDPLRFCDDLNEYTLTLTRPDHPGIDQDLRYALELAKQREAQLQKDLERERLYADHFWMYPHFGFGLYGPWP